MTEAILPCNIEANDADVARANDILKDNTNYIVRYIRHNATVALGLKPRRNKDGGIISDAPYVRRRVICSGVPYGCMIAFQYQDNLFIGWSKRYEARVMIETQELHELFKNAVVEVSEKSEGYQSLFESFCTKLVRFLSCQQPKETEISFSKTAGKVAAIIRGLKDNLIVNGNYFTSSASGPVPGEVAKQLAQFIEYAEQVYGCKAVNVGNPDSLPTAPTETAISVA